MQGGQPRFSLNRGKRANMMGDPAPEFRSPLARGAGIRVETPSLPWSQPGFLNCTVTRLTMRQISRQTFYTIVGPIASPPSDTLTCVHPRWQTFLIRRGRRNWLLAAIGLGRRGSAELAADQLSPIGTSPMLSGGLPSPPPCQLTSCRPLGTHCRSEHLKSQLRLALRERGEEMWRGEYPDVFRIRHGSSCCRRLPADQVVQIWLKFV